MNYIFNKREPKVGDRGFIIENRFIPINMDVVTPKYIRFQIDAIRGNYTTVVQMSEFKLLDNSYTEVSLSALGKVTVTATPNKNSSSESPEKLIDNSVYTKWCNSAYASPTVVDFEFDTPIKDLYAVYKGYCWYTANDYSDRDPISWTVYISENGSTWRQISKVENATITKSRRVLAGTWSWDT